MYIFLSPCAHAVSSLLLCDKRLHVQAVVVVVPECIMRQRFLPRSLLLLEREVRKIRTPLRAAQTLFEYFMHMKVHAEKLQAFSCCFLKHTARESE
jgi:hypothetical protein